MTPRSFLPDDSPEEADLAKLLLERIEDMLEAGKYNWASDTLEGIYETVMKSGRVSEGQRRAVDNIERSRER